MVPGASTGPTGREAMLPCYPQGFRPGLFSDVPTGLWFRVSLRMVVMAAAGCSFFAVCTL
jgi:hypothetical protein